MKKFNTRIGALITWSDYIKSKKINNNLHYYQSNTKMDGYSQRYIGLLLLPNNDIYVAITLNSKQEDKGVWYKFILENRIRSIMDGVEEKAATMVPMPYLDLLYKDPYVYSPLYGPIEPNLLDQAIKMAQLANQQEIDAKINKYRESTTEA